MRKILCFLGFHSFEPSVTFDADYAYFREKRFCEKCKREIITGERGNRDEYLVRLEERKREIDQLWGRNETTTRT